MQTDSGSKRMKCVQTLNPKHLEATGYETELSKGKSPKSSAGQHLLSLDNFRDAGNNRVWWMVFAFMMITTTATRFYTFDKPDYVCWDEAHFGKYAGYYINRTFFFDVHPPLGKMMIALFGYLDGYNATFSFEKPGVPFEDYPYLGMRGGCNVMGALLVPLSFLIVWEMTFSLPAATMAGLLNLLDTGMITLNRFILLDPPMLFFIAMSVYTMVKFHNQRHRPFSLSWWTWLSFLGVNLACAVGVKFVGVFVVLLVGFRVIADLWDILGDMSRPVSYTVKHFMARALCLIALPTVVYVGIFYVHLLVLNKSGPGDGFYSSAFQVSLINNHLHNGSVPAEVAYGAVLTVKNSITNGGYLHSHAHDYPEEMGGEQQITTYSHKDVNNDWHIKRYNRIAPSWNSTKPIDFVRNGDLIRLEHLETGRNLHALGRRGPITPRNFQVCGFGDEGVGDHNDIWRIEIEGGEANETLRTMQHRFKLIHYYLNCALVNTKKQLPAWGFEQDEVSCSPNLRDPNAYWSIEGNTFPRLPNVSFSSFELNFFERFVESHFVMITGNAGLKPKENEITSKPWMWPILLRGQWFAHTTYLLGNPVIWWGNMVFMVLYLVLWIVVGVRDKRGTPISDRQKMVQKRTLHACNWLFIGWLLHYAPFWSMGRILYFHHYFPAVLFTSMMTGVILDYFFETIPANLPRKMFNKSYLIVAGSAVLVLFYSFYLFSPLTYGIPFRDHNGHYSENGNQTMQKIRWMSTWEF